MIGFFLKRTDVNGMHSEMLKKEVQVHWLGRFNCENRLKNRPENESETTLPKLKFHTQRPYGTLKEKDLNKQTVDQEATEPRTS